MAASEPPDLTWDAGSVDFEVANDISQKAYWYVCYWFWFSTEPWLIQVEDTFQLYEENISLIPKLDKDVMRK